MYMLFWWFHVWLGTQRVMYIYHYFIGLSMSFFLVALCFKIVSRRVPFIARHRFSILCATSLAIAGTYLFYSPLTYHYPLTKPECEMRNVPVTVVICQPVKKKKPEAAVASPPPLASK
jgi:dolichyl-phosphate-mannose--protein O-mannosyl transferase